MNLISKGKRITLYLISLVLLSDILATLIFILLSASNNDAETFYYILSQSFFRLIFEGVISYFVYKGHIWAKWLLAVVLIIVGGFCLLMAYFNSDLLFLLFSILPIALTYTLLSSSAIKEFMKSQTN